MDKRLEKTTERNREYFFEFERYLKDEKKLSKGTITTYRNDILMFLDYIEDMEVDSFGINVLGDFLLRFDNASTVNAKIYALKGYFQIVKRKEELKFDLTELEEFKSNSSLVNSDKQNAPKPLTIEEIVQLRALLKKNKDYRRWFSFEMTYQYDFSLKELARCTLKTWDSLSTTFNFKEDVVIRGHALYLIRHQNVLPRSKISTTTHQLRISELNRHLDRNVKYSDLNATRNRTFFSCPRCDNPYESSPENWSIFEYSMDGSKWIVCKECSGEQHE